MKVRNAVAALDGWAAALVADPGDIGYVAISCELGYIHFPFNHLG